MRLSGWFLICGWILFGSGLALAQTPAFTQHREFTADLTTLTQSGRSVLSHIAVDGDRVRAETSVQGIIRVIILRPDLHKVYQVMPAQKMVIVLPYDQDALKRQASIAALAQKGGIWERLGADTVDGVACQKYKLTTTEGESCWFWINSATNLPWQIQSEDGVVTTKVSNFQASQPNLDLFTPPADFQTVNMDNTVRSGI